MDTRARQLLRIFAIGIILVILAWGFFMIGSHMTCKRSDGLVVDGLSFLKVRCFNLETMEGFESGGQIYLLKDGINGSFLNEIDD